MHLSTCMLIVLYMSSIGRAGGNWVNFIHLFKSDMVLLVFYSWFSLILLRKTEGRARKRVCGLILNINMVPECAGFHGIPLLISPADWLKIVQAWHWCVRCILAIKYVAFLLVQHFVFTFYCTAVGMSDLRGGMELSRRWRVNLTRAQKREICAYSDLKRKASQQDIADYFTWLWGFEMKRRTVGDILSEREKWIANNDTVKKDHCCRGFRIKSHTIVPSLKTIWRTKPKKSPEMWE